MDTAKTFEVPTMKVYGEMLDELPRDLYIPPEALQLYLESFEGPLDLLLYLIRKAKFNVLDIPMAALTRQYLEYVETMRKTNLNLAAEYLVMAAMMIDIKCRMLLPRMADETAEDDDEEDPRVALVRRLLQYEQIQKAAMGLQESPQVGRDFFWGMSETVFSEKLINPSISSKDLVLVWQDLLTRLKHRANFEVESEPLSMREQMSTVLKLLQNTLGRYVDFFTLFENASTLKLVMGFIAILELSKQGLVDLQQASRQFDSQSADCENTEKNTTASASQSLLPSATAMPILYVRACVGNEVDK